MPSIYLSFYLHLHLHLQVSCIIDQKLKGLLKEMAKAQGRGSAVGRGVAVAAVIGLVMMSQLESFVAAAAVFNVGDAGGWTFNVESWPKGKRFHPGDILKFNYDPSIHNVVVVDQAGYANCRTPAGAKVYKSGHDQITLPKGQSYFICNFAGHCESAMKIAVNAV